MTAYEELLQARLERAEKTLALAGYTDCGGELWKPPIGKPPAPPPVPTIDTSMWPQSLRGAYELFLNAPVGSVVRGSRL